MYRTQQMMEKATREESGLNSEFFARVSQLPVVTFAWGYASDTYGRIKEHNKLFNYTLSTAEKSVQFAARQAKPVVLKFEKQLHAVDELALGGLQILEKTAPIITRSPDQILGETGKLYRSALRNGTDGYEGLKIYGTERVKAARDYGVGRAVALLNTPYGIRLVGSVDGAVDLTESCVDYYLPALEDEGETDSTVPRDRAVLDRVGRLSGKMRRRLYGRAAIGLRDLRKRGLESVGGLDRTVDLIRYARDNLTVSAALGTVRDHASRLWEEFGKTEEEDSDTEKNWDRRVLSVARQIAGRMMNAYNGTTSVVELLPDHVQQRLSTARDYSVELYNYFTKTAHLDDVTNVMLKQVQENLRFIEETFGSYFESVLHSQPLSWLVPSKDTAKGTTSEVIQEK